MMKGKTTIRVRYADTDQMRFVYNGKFFEYFEVGRTELLRVNGLTYKQIEDNGYYMPVREVKIEYKTAALYDEELEIETWAEKLPSPLMHLQHRVRSVERDVIICEGYIDLIFVRAETGRACKPPEFFINAIKEYYD
ncbi:MAG: acyl-CoA thioesterase [Ignavibacteriales bacterium]|nr:acyl-CoA thioesterase [Ignavibacteriales bacterium]